MRRRSRSRTQKQDLTIYWKQRSDSAYDSIVYDHVETRLSESQAEAEELNQSQSLGKSIVIGLSFRFCFQFPQCGSHWIISNGVVSGVKRKWKRSDSSDYDSVALVTAYDFDFWSSQGHKRSYNSAYDSDSGSGSGSGSVTSENYPIGNVNIRKCLKVDPVTGIKKLPKNKIMFTSQFSQ